jgi:uncharacterized membrane protein YheB (UPF0754 family)
MKIQLHSVTDLITNSSTTIYTYSDRSLGALRQMIDSVFKTFGINKTCDDVFAVSIQPESYDRYHDAISELEELPKELEGWGKASWSAQDGMIGEFLDKIATGEAEKPDWLEDIEERVKRSRQDGEGPSTVLNIVPKKPEYENLAELVTKFLYSVDHEEGSC